MHKNSFPALFNLSQLNNYNYNLYPRNRYNKNVPSTRRVSTLPVSIQRIEDQAVKMHERRQDFTFPRKKSIALEARMQQDTRRWNDQELSDKRSSLAHTHIYITRMMQIARQCRSKSFFQLPKRITQLRSTLISTGILFFFFSRWKREGGISSSTQREFHYRDRYLGRRLNVVESRSTFRGLLRQLITVRGIWSSIKCPIPNEI